MQIIVDGLLTNYERTGKGQLVLLLHGWGDELATFRDLQKQLTKKYQVTSLDLPGFGKTEAPKGVWGLEEYANFVKSFLAKTEIKQVYAIIGHSNGGALAIKGLANGSLSASKLILLAAAGIRDKHRFKKLLTKAVAKTGKVATFWLPDHKKKSLQKKLYGTVGSDMLAVPHLQDTFKKTVAQDVQTDAKKIQTPTLLIYAAEDKAVPVEYGQLYAKLIPNSKLEVVPEAEHFIHHDQPEAVTKSIEDFLNV